MPWKSQSPLNWHLQASGSTSAFHKHQYSILLHKKNEGMGGGGGLEGKGERQKICNCWILLKNSIADIVVAAELVLTAKAPRLYCQTTQYRVEFPSLHSPSATFFQQHFYDTGVLYHESKTNQNTWNFPTQLLLDRKKCCGIAWHL